ncbi:MAG TPA: ATP-binding cassette domain-containing protein [Solirubrobacterales bacterium]|nr:ATP-binding cassette domain-containing protein [Solirubrobacterales bacterium]
MTEEIERLKGELSRAIAHRCALQEALAASEGERAALRGEDRALRAESERVHALLTETATQAANLHGALNVVQMEKARLEAALEASLRVTDKQLAREPAAREQERAEEHKQAPEAVEAVAEDEKTAEPEPLAKPVPLRVLSDAAVIEVRELKKKFRIPAHQMETLKEQVLHPIRSRRGTDLRALRGISFDVRQGEFLGIAGANGSGKSTLLKILANVYTADEGTVRMAGRVAPFIELGVGLNPELAAFDNVMISGVMMGLAPDEVRSLYPEIMSFAGLEAFGNVKLKNYSSGMRVRLAFAVMAQVDADILLIDEVLAVGDAEFRSKCLERLRRLREEGKTIVFVTHSMDTMAKDCDRGILLSDGRIALDGDPAEVARRYQDEGIPPVAEESEPPADGTPTLRVVER